MKCAVAVATLFLVAMAPRAFAQLPAPGVIAFTGARVIDGTGAAPIEQATIVVTNGRVTAIGPSATLPEASSRVWSPLPAEVGAAMVAAGGRPVGMSAKLRVSHWKPALPTGGPVSWWARRTR